MSSFQGMFDAMDAAHRRKYGRTMWADAPAEPVKSRFVPESQTLPPVDPAVPSAHVRTAYHLRQSPLMVNGEHAVLDQPLNSGRLHRVTGDALCKPATKFWGLEQSSNLRTVTCPRCAALATRHGITIRTPQKEN